MAHSERGERGRRGDGGVDGIRGLPGNQVEGCSSAGGGGDARTRPGPVSAFTVRRYKK